MSRRRTPRRFRLLEVYDSPITSDIPDDEERCGSTFPPCPNIRCQKGKHDSDQVCRASRRYPYYAIFWEMARSIPKEINHD